MSFSNIYTFFQFFLAICFLQMIHVLDIDRFARRWSYCIYIIFNALTSILRGMIQCLSSTYQDPCTGEQVISYFNKPWFLNVVMGLSMAFSLVVHFIKNKSSIDYNIKVPTIYWLILPLLSLCDVFQCWALNSAIDNTNASLGSLVVVFDITFILIIRSLVLKQKIYGYVWFSTLIINISIILMSLADILSDGSSVELNAQFLSSLGFQIFGEFLHGIQYITQEHILQKTAMKRELFLGVVGVYDILISLFIGIPIAYFIKDPKWGHFHEDLCQTVQMFVNSPSIIVVTCTYFIISVVMNLGIVSLLYYTSALHAAISNGFAAFIAWVICLLVGVSTEGTKAAALDSLIGENWSNWSYLKISCYLAFMFGLLCMTRSIRIPCFEYETDAVYIVPMNEATVPLQ